jgi:hypothetical protein
MGFQLVTAPAPNLVVVVDIADIVAYVLLGLAAVYVTRAVVAGRTAVGSAQPTLVVYVQSRDGPYSGGPTVLRVLRSGVPASHPIVYVCLSRGGAPQIVGNTTPAVKTAITNTLANVNAAVVCGSLDTVRDGLRYNAGAATVSDCCKLLGVEPHTEFADVLSHKPAILWLLDTPSDPRAVCAAIQCFGCHAHRNLLPTLQAAAATC